MRLWPSILKFQLAKVALFQSWLRKGSSWLRNSLPWKSISGSSYYSFVPLDFIVLLYSFCYFLLLSATNYWWNVKKKARYHVTRSGYIIYMYQLQLSTIAAASSIATTAKTSGSQGTSQNTNEGTNDARRGTHDNREHKQMRVGITNARRAGAHTTRGRGGRCQRRAEDWW